MSRLADILFARRDSSPSPSVMVGFPMGGGIFPSGVTPRTAYGLSAVWRSLDILSTSCSQLPWVEKRGNLDLPASRLVRNPIGLVTRRDWVNYVVAVLALYDVCYLLKVGGVDAEGVPVGLLPLDPAQVYPSNPVSSVSPLIPAEEYTVGQTVVQRDQLVILRRSPLPGVDESSAGLIRLARTEFAGYLAASGYNSRYWQSGGSPQVVLETDQQLPDAIATQMSDRWRERRSKGPDYAPVLQGGLKARDFGADPTLASAVEVRKEMVADVGRYFGIPTSKLNAPTGDPTTYDSTEAQGQDLLKFTLAGYLGAIEDAITDQLPGGRRMEMQTAKLTVSTVLSQAQALQLATGGKAWMDVDEARELWNLAPVESPDTLNPEPAPASAAAGGFDNG